MLVGSIVESSVFFLEFLQFHIFLTSRETLLIFFWQKNIKRFVRSVFCMSAENFQEYQFSWEAFYLLNSFGLSAMVFRTFAKKTSVKSVKTAFNVWTEKVRGEPFTSEKIITFFFFGLLSIVFPWGFQNCLLRVQRKLLRGFTGTLSALSSDLGKKISNFCL